jgi:hypothetical protein
MPIHERAETRPTDIDRETILHDGVRTWLRNPALTDAQRKEIEKLLPEEEARDTEAATIPANQAMNRYKELTTMDYTTSDAMAKTLAELDAAINGPSPARLAKNLEDLEDRVDAHRAHDQQVDDDHARQLQGLREDVADLRRRGVSSDAIKHMFGKMRDDLLAALDEKEEERRPETEEESANKSLTRVAASFLDENSTRADATKVVSWLVKSFGRRGGQHIKYNKELAGRLLLSKSISAGEHENWKRYDRLPDDVTLQSAGRAQPQADAAMLRAHMLAGMNVSPLALQYYFMQRR